jgi:hypothetical protein
MTSCQLKFQLFCRPTVIAVKKRFTLLWHKFCLLGHGFDRNFHVFDHDFFWVIKNNI